MQHEMASAPIAKKLVELCREGKFMEATKSLYSDKIVSVEACEMGENPRTTEGLANIIKKSEWWTENHIIHSCKVGDPFLATDKFVVEFTIDVTFKPTGKRMTMSEVGVYTVENGKVTREEFMYRA